MSVDVRLAIQEVFRGFYGASLGKKPSSQGDSENRENTFYRHLCNCSPAAIRSAGEWFEANSEAWPTIGEFLSRVRYCDTGNETPGTISDSVHVLIESEDGSRSISTGSKRACIANGRQWLPSGCLASIQERWKSGAISASEAWEECRADLARYDHEGNLKEGDAEERKPLAIPVPDLFAGEVAP